jgi:hypothetical protein
LTWHTPKALGAVLKPDMAASGACFGGCSALGFAGTILMKSDEQLQYVETTGGPLAVLKAVGLPWPQQSTL